MRLKWIALALLVAAGFSAWQAESRAELKQRLLLRALVAQTAAQGQLSYGATTAHFWGSGRIENLRFTPSEALAAAWGWPAGKSLHIPALTYRDWQDGPVWPRRADLRFNSLSAPLPDPWPREASGSLDWRYQADSGDLRLSLALEAPRAARIDGSLALQLTTPQRLRGAILRSGRWSYRDAGFAQGQRAALGLRRGVAPENASSALAESLKQWLTAQGLPPSFSQRLTLDAFAREPLALAVQLDPPGALRPEILGQFAPEDRSAALGLSLEVP